MKNIENNLKVFKQNKAITLVALVITVVVMLILAGVAIAAVVDGDGLFSKTRQATETYENAANRENAMLTNLMGKIDYYLGEGENDDVVNPGDEVPKSDGTFDVNTGINSPDTSALPTDSTKYVTWSDDDSDGTFDENLSDTVPNNWYDYNNGQWANIKSTANGLEAYWVWIPRFAYKLPESSTAKQIEVAFVKNDTKTVVLEDGTEVQGYYTTDTEITSDGSGLYSKKTSTAADQWIIHPAFTFGDTQLSGIWVGKYETSSSDPSASDGGGNVTNLQAQIKPGVTSWRYIQPANMFTVCENIKKIGGVIGNNSSAIDTHMMKNIEWGAVAILSQSKYGVYNPKSANGGQVWNNSNNSYITGEAGSTKNAYSEATGTTNAYNTGNGPKASTTGTVYGIYDMAEGTHEYVMGLMSPKTDSTVPSVGWTSTDNTGFTGKLHNGTAYTGVRELPDRKYYDMYAYGTSYTDYTRGKIGDATSEMMPKNYRTWNNDCAGFTQNWSTVFQRGGGRGDGDGTGAGVFNFNRFFGYASKDTSFRAVLLGV